MSVELFEVESVGLVGVAGDGPGSVGYQAGVVVGAATGADRGEVGEVVASTLAAWDEVMDLPAGASIAAGEAAMPVA